jgi:predicted nuclease of predicted toxin-antitoxin system
LRDRFLVDECLSVSLLAFAKERGIAADHVSWLGKGGWQDRNLVPFALDNDYIVVTNNRRHFLREYAKQEVHNGLVVIVPAVDRLGQQRLFEKALDALANLNDDVANKVVEVLSDGSVHIREWTREDHDIGHISDPRWD